MTWPFPWPLLGDPLGRRSSAIKKCIDRLRNGNQYQLHPYTLKLPMCSPLPPPASVGYALFIYLKRCEATSHQPLSQRFSMWLTLWKITHFWTLNTISYKHCHGGKLHCKQFLAVFLTISYRLNRCGQIKVIPLYFPGSIYTIVQFVDYDNSELVIFFNIHQE